MILVLSTVIYFPFFKVQDNIAYQNELAAEKLNSMLISITMT
ncbi:hypothetical protein [Streptococcus equi]|nr:hypothetical protein [Streptococcus equi]